MHNSGKQAKKEMCSLSFINERIRWYSSQLFFRCYYFYPAVFVVQWVIRSRISLYDRERHRWARYQAAQRITGKPGLPKLMGSWKSYQAFEKKYSTISTEKKHFFLFVRIFDLLKRRRRWASFCVYIRCSSLLQTRD